MLTADFDLVSQQGTGLGPATDPAAEPAFLGRAKTDVVDASEAEADFDSLASD